MIWGRFVGHELGIIPGGMSPGGMSSDGGGRVVGSVLGSGGKPGGSWTCGIGIAIGLPTGAPASAPLGAVVLPLVVRALLGSERGADGVAVFPPPCGRGATPSVSISVCSVICVTPASPGMRGCGGGGPKSRGCVRYQAAAPPPPSRTNDKVNHQIARDRRRGWCTGLGIWAPIPTGGAVLAAAGAAGQSACGIDAVFAGPGAAAPT